MFTAKFIKNIFLEKEALRAIGRSGKKTRVFAKQGDLDGSCTIYSLMMMLIFHHKLDWEDLIDGERAKDCEYVGRIQHEFLHGLNGLCTNGFKLREISDRANKCFGSKMCEAYTTEPDTPNTVSRCILQEMIKTYLDERQPVMIGYSKPSGPGHALVAVAYRKEAWNRLRLFCLDPSHALPFMYPWNTIIDLDFLTSEDDDFTDTNYWTEKKVCVNDFLVVVDLPAETGCPF